MRLKDDSVRPVGLHPRLTEVLLRDVDFIARVHLGYEPVITSLNDSHATGLHPKGKGADLRTWTEDDSGVQIGDVRRRKLVVALRLALGKDFDVIAEPDHIHIEYDPKQPT